MNDPADLAACVLESLVAQLDRARHSLPGRRYVHAGDVAYDCEELVVHGLSVYAGAPGFPQLTPVTDTTMFTCELGVTIVRRVPGPNNRGAAPTPDALDVAGRKSLSDAGALIRAALAARTERGGLCAGCELELIGPVAFNGPLGEFTGSTMHLAIQLN